MTAYISNQPLDRELAEAIEAADYNTPQYRQLERLRTLLWEEREQHDGKLVPAKKLPELRDQRFQLSGDARLQFWREAYLRALPALIAACPHGGLGDGGWLRQLTAAAETIADSSLAAHLQRNDVEWPDSCVDVERQAQKNLRGG